MAVASIVNTSSTDATLVITKYDEEVWIPNSQVHEIHRGPEPSVVMTAWIAKKKGFL